jgi:DNA-binding transcriptional ArsR family regulator
MVKYSDGLQLDSTFGALSDSVRRGILARLALGEASVTDLAKPFNISMPAVLKHVRVLESAGLIESRKDGRTHRCLLVAAPLQSAAQWIEYYHQFWDKQLESLASYLESTQIKEKRSWKDPMQKSRRFKSKGESRRAGKKSSRHGPKRIK